MTSHTLHELHDAVLSQIQLRWEEGTLEIVLRPVSASHDLIVHFEGLTRFHCPRLAPWGPSIYVNRVTGPIIDIGTRRRLQIEMQSGDVLEIEYQSHCIGESTPHSAADPTNDPANEQNE
jgi:hypothetical protein